jgi:site-specific DNA-methyltransferase (adenine-specific)
MNHPTQKPEALIKRIISASSNKGNIILDPFVGSGTTCAVADFLDRKWIGVDINPEYIKMSKERIAKKNDTLDSFDIRELRISRDCKLYNNEQTRLLE